MNQRSTAPPSVLPDISPHLGGDWLSQPPSPIYDVAGMSGAPKLPISPLVGEMSGRTEGGAVGYLPPHRSGN
ncbi:hypothetical protein FJ949_24905 [Mesorhizobium sp. B2-4-1]|nr:hypothetical protein FJ947_23645 [Mesorhizobium sp. B2-4-8]TPL60822.1 hypothetical protein FJ949_24905 [Mesorhizobium sp. B2-4-1]